MPIPSNQIPVASPAPAPAPPGLRQSVFANYRSRPGETPPAPGPVGAEAAAGRAGATAEEAIAAAVGRAFIYRLLARAFEYPSQEAWGWLSNSIIQGVLSFEIRRLTPGDEDPLRHRCQEFISHLDSGAFEAFARQYAGVFGHAARGPCPMNEIEYGDLRADPLFQPHRLADLAAFYQAFGLERTDDAGERHDHICAELEFMSVLAAKEAHALQVVGAGEGLAVSRQAQRAFLREHLALWTPAFLGRLARLAGDGVLGALGSFAQAYILDECARWSVAPGSKDLALRPVDEAADSLCASCGLASLPPGATVPAPANR